MKMAYLGPQGTFTEEALLAHVKIDTNDLVPYPTEQDVILAVENSEVDKGIVPIENSIEGSVNVTLDMLTFESNLVIEREIIYPIQHHLIAPKNLRFEEITSVVSHPQATAQCRGFLQRKLPGAAILPANSTADAVRRVAEMDGSLAAIGTRLAAIWYSLAILREDIADHKDNVTRFVVVGREPQAPTGKDKTSIVAFIYEDRPGSLMSILSEFADRGINLTKLQSRPTKKALGEYCFWIDLEGHIEDESIVEAIEALKQRIREVKILGSFPRAPLPEA